jgi:hypothetical protein
MARVDSESQKKVIVKRRNADETRKGIMAQGKSRRGVVTPGKFYFFRYYAKGYRTLPVWDKFPLVLPLDRSSKGFQGLNVHYLNIPQRRWLLQILEGYKTAKGDRIKMYYELMKTIKRLDFARPALKRYLWGYVATQFIEVDPEEWAESLNLPVEEFIYKKGLNG